MVALFAQQKKKEEKPTREKRAGGAKKPPHSWRQPNAKKNPDRSVEPPTTAWVVESQSRRKPRSQIGVSGRKIQGKKTKKQPHKNFDRAKPPRGPRY